MARPHFAHRGDRRPLNWTDNALAISVCDEVVTLVEQWQTLDLGQRLAEHIAEVQPRRVAISFAARHKRRVGSIRLGLPRRDLLEQRQPQQVVHQDDCPLPAPTMNDHSGLDDRR